MNFTNLPVSDIWLDFTRFTPMEEAISTVENVFSKWSNTNIYSCEKARFGFQNVYYYLNYVPKDYSPSTSLKEQYISIPNNTIDQIKGLFGINSPFVYITNGDEINNKIENKMVYTLLSILRPSAQTAKFTLPIIIQIAKLENATFIGFKLNKNVETLYSTNIDFALKKPIDSLTTVKNNFNDSISKIFKNKEIKDLSTSYRINLKFNEDSIVGKNVHYQCVKFYSFMSNDPIQHFYISCNFNNLEAANDQFFNINNAADICVSVEKICSVYYKANTEIFIENMKKCQNYKSWKQILQKGISQTAKNQISEIFAQYEKQDENCLSEKSILKAAPKNSLLSGIVELLLDSKDLLSLASIWTEFVKEIRRRVDHLQYIPGVGKNGPELEHCLYYQKLEMLNLCIKCMINQNNKTAENTKSDEINKSDQSQDNTSKFLIDGKPMIFPETQEAPPRTEDQIESSVQLLVKNMDDQRQKAILQSDQLKSDMSDFKRANPTAVFEDFVYWYSPADFDPESKKLSKRMNEENNVWKELWSKASTSDNEKSLFDPVYQSEYALDYFESLVPLEVIGDLIPVILSTIYFDFYESVKNISTIYHVKKSIDAIEEQINKFHTEVEQIEGTLSLDKYIDISLNIFKAIEQAMLVIHSANSLMRKFNNNLIITSQLLENGNCIIANEDDRSTLISFLEIIGINCQSGKFPSENFIFNKHCITNGFVEEKDKKLQQRIHISHYPDRIIYASTTQEII